MAHQRKKTTIGGALIFAMLVAMAGFSFAVTGHFSDPFSFFQAFQALQSSNEQIAATPNPARGQIHNDGSGTLAYHGQANHSHTGSGTGNRIAWPLFGAVLFDIWVLFAITACYILIQHMLGFLINRFRSQKSSEISA